MVIYRGGEEVERIMEMDILIAILMDMQMPVYKRHT
jgi:hypothetical protein